MDVLFISRCLPYPLHFGDRLLTYYLIRELHARGHRFDLIALYLEESDIRGTPHFAEMFDQVEAIQDRPRSPVDYLKRLAHPFPDRAARCWNPEMWETIQRRLTRRRYDIVHLFGGIQIYEYCNLVRSLPNIIVPYDSYALFMKRAVAGATGFRDRIRLQAVSAVTHLYERMIFEGFDRTVLVSEKDQEYLCSFAPNLVTTVIPNGVDTDLFKPVLASTRTPALVFVGNYEYLPNVAAAVTLIVEILPQIRLAIPEARVVVVGPKPPVALTSLAGEGVEITGYVPDVRPYLAQATCFVAPLTLGSGIRNKILEAMAMKVPVVTTPLGCEGIAVTAGKDVLLGNNPKELAEAVMSLFRDEALRNRVANAGHQLVQRQYDWRETAAQYERLYNEVVAEYRARQSP